MLVAGKYGLRKLILVALYAMNNICVVFFCKRNRSTYNEVRNGASIFLQCKVVMVLQVSYIGIHDLAMPSRPLGRAIDMVIASCWAAMLVSCHAYHTLAKRVWFFEGTVLVVSMRETKGKPTAFFFGRGGCT